MIKRFISFLVYSNIWISLGCACFAWLFYQLNNLDVNISLLAFLFFSTLLTYTYQRFEKITRKEQFHGPRMKWMETNFDLVKGLMFGSIILVVWLALYLKLISIIILGIGGIISFFYAYKFNLTNKKTNLRDIPGIKIYLIGLVWAITCCLIPWIEEEQTNEFILNFSTGFFLFIIGITIPFDIRDVELDENTKKTIPQTVGVGSSKIIAALCIVASTFFLMPTGINIKLIISLLPVIPLILFSSTNRFELFYSFFLDGLLILVPVSYYLLQSL